MKVIVMIQEYPSGGTGAVAITVTGKRKVLKLGAYLVGDTIHLCSLGHGFRYFTTARNDLYRYRKGPYYIRANHSYVQRYWRLISDYEAEIRQALYDARDPNHVEEDEFEDDDEDEG